MEYWEESLLQHTVDLWKPARTLTGVDWSQVSYRNAPEQAAVRCFHNRNPSVSQLEMFGRTEQDDIFTLDVFWFPVGQVVDEGWVIVEKSLNPDGSQAQDFGEGFVCRGGFRPLRDLPYAPGGHVEIVASSLPKLYAGITV
jgi:hypothetical protein